MSREYQRFDIPEDCLPKLIQWVAGQPHAALFAGSGWGNKIDHSHRAFAGVGRLEWSGTSPEEVSQFCAQHDDYLIGHFAYEFAEQLHPISSLPAAQLAPDPARWWRPVWTIALHDDHVIIGKAIESDAETSHDSIFQQIIHSAAPTDHHVPVKKPMPRWSKSHYVKQLDQCREHLLDGDIYQANICQQFTWENTELDVAARFYHGWLRNPNPFSALYRSGDRSVLCWSPERFVTTKGRQVLSQPMKGTSPRGKTPEEDQNFKRQLIQSEKDRRENVMIVDMVRNDLSAFATPNSVQVPSLYEVETYPRVHQMHSTVVATIRDEVPMMQAVMAAFPMGSMTGAPKVSAMNIIADIEGVGRGHFSGSLGFVCPNGDMDLNVVIRSLVYDHSERRAIAHVGGGITVMSDHEAEYEESLVKFDPLQSLMCGGDSDGESYF